MDRCLEMERTTTKLPLVTREVRPFVPVLAGALRREASQQGAPLRTWRLEFPNPQVESVDGINPMEVQLREQEEDTIDLLVRVPTPME